MDRRSPQLTRRDPAGLVDGDERLHGFVGEPAEAACGAGPLASVVGAAFDPETPAAVCEACAANFRRYERWRKQGLPDRRTSTGA